MPNYYNPYNFYPATYQPMSYGMQTQPQMPMAQQSYASPQGGQAPKMMEWVEGEVGAKAFQMPNGWPANSPIPLWDSTDTVIYLKSWGPMGIPNPMQKLRYEMPEQQNHALLMGGNSGSQGGNSGNGQQQNNQDMSQYVTKQDLEEIKRDMIKAINSQSGGNSGNVNPNGSNNQNGSNNGQNRGANR